MEYPSTRPRHAADKVAIVLLAALTIAAAFPLLASGRRISQDSDFLLYCTYHRIARDSLLHFGQFPFRTPYLGGGYPFASEPESPVFSPFFLLTLCFGEVVGLKSIAAVMYAALALGGYGMMRRVLALPPLESFFGAALLAASGWMPGRLASANYPELCYAFAPLALMLWVRSVERGKGLLWPALVLAALLMDGRQAWMAIMVFLAAFAVLRTLETAAGQVTLRLKWLTSYLALCLAVASLGAVKIVPVLHAFSLRGGAMPAHHSDVYSPATIGAMDWRFLSALVQPTCRNDMPDAYIGWVATALFALGVLCRARRAWRVLALLVIFTWLALAHHARLDLFRMLWITTPLHYIDYPLKYFDFFIVLGVVCFASYGLAGLRRALRGHTGLATTVVLGALSIAWPLAHSIRQNSTLYRAPPRPNPPAGKFCHTLGIGMPGGRHRYPECSAYFYLRRNMAALDWEAEITLPVRPQPKYFVTPANRLKPNSRYKGEAYGLKPASAVRILELTPHRVALDVTTQEADTICINQNYDPRWRCDTAPVLSERGLVAVRLPGAGRYRLQLRYNPWDSKLGLLIAFVSLVAIAAWPQRWQGAGWLRAAVPLHARSFAKPSGAIALAVLIAAVAALWCVRVGPAVERDDWLSQAAQADRAGDYGAALRFCQLAAVASPRAGRMGLHLSRAYLKAGQYREAASGLQAYLRGRPNDPDAWFYLAQAFWGQGRPKRAAEAGRKVGELSPFDPAAHANLALYLAAAGDSKRASGALARAIELGYKDVSGIRRSPVWDKYRTAPEFAKLLGQLEPRYPRGGRQ